MTIKVQDLADSDKKIPRNLIMNYQGKPYVLKAGLEFKANLLFKGGSWGVTTEIVERKEGYVLAKAIFKTKDGVEFSNYGEASKNNVQNTMMHKYLLHLAVTRAECRVLRMATASAYVSAEEMEWYGENGKQLPSNDKDNEPITPAQSQTIKKLGGEVKKDMTQREAKQKIAELVEVK